MNWKRLSAVIGASAAVAMGALGVIWSEKPTGAGHIMSVEEMTLGETTTEEAAPLEVETSVAAPEVTAEPPEGFGP